MHSSTVIVFSFSLVCYVRSFQGDIPRPRGVSIAKASLYQSQYENWTCLDGKKMIAFQQINDDYCDCIDGSDEPGTSACAQGQFHCANVGHRSEDVPSSRVNDGICDCCDGSDEYVSNSCKNTCLELGRAEQEQRRSIAELHKRGATKRSEMISKGIQLKADRDVKRAELERRRLEQEAIKNEKETLKRNAEAEESAALEVYKAQQRDQGAMGRKEEKESTSMSEEAHSTFIRYDTNKDGAVDVTELQVDVTFDRDRNGVVSVEEAKYFLDERETLDWDAFLTLAWPRIKSVQMLAEGLFKPPAWTPETAVEDKVELVNDAEDSQYLENTEHQQQQYQHEDYPDADTYDGEEEDEDDADVELNASTAVGKVTEENIPTADYDPETQQIIESANEARNAFAETERIIREIEQEIREIDEQNSKNYGENEEFAALDGECFNFEEREYVYTLCPFDRASQKPRSGGAETTLGRWDQWVAVGNNKYAKQRYAHGASCWNGPQRSAVVQLKCALDHKVISVTEPNRCEYYFEFETPAACDDIAFAAETEKLHDEL